MSSIAPPNTHLVNTLRNDHHSLALAKRLLRGCGWFAVCMGTLIAAMASWLLDGPLLSQPQWAHQVLGHFLWGRLPTFLVGMFLLFRVSLHVRLHSELTQSVQLHIISPWSLTLSCAIPAVLCWMWLLLVATGLTGLAVELLLGGHAKPLLLRLVVEGSPWPLWHGGMRLLATAMAVAWVSFVELRFLGAHLLEPSIAFMRAIVLGGIVVIGLELVDFFLFFA